MPRLKKRGVMWLQAISKTMIGIVLSVMFFLLAMLGYVSEVLSPGHYDKAMLPLDSAVTIDSFKVSQPYAIAEIPYDINTKWLTLKLKEELVMVLDESKPGVVKKAAYYSYIQDKNTFITPADFKPERAWDFDKSDKENAGVAPKLKFCIDRGRITVKKQSEDCPITRLTFPGVAKVFIIDNTNIRNLGDILIKGINETTPEAVKKPDNAMLNIILNITKDMAVKVPKNSLKSTELAEKIILDSGLGIKPVESGELKVKHAILFELPADKYTAVSQSIIKEVNNAFR